MTVGERIKQRRKQLGMSAEFIAEKLNMHPSTIYRYENGEIEKFGIDKLKPIAAILQTTVSSLMGWEENKPAKNDELMIELFKQLSDDNKQVILNLVRQLSDHKD
jgi:transcriptional regulator with XRE-family HTH domain